MRRADCSLFLDGNIKMITKSVIMDDNTKIVYDEYGQLNHQTLFLLHGNGSSARYFRRQITQYETLFHVIAIDTRGHGRSSNAKDSINITDIILDINTLRLKLGVSHIFLLGYSDGANIAIKYATLYPKNVTRMVLNAPNVSKDGVYKVLWFVDDMAQFFTGLLAYVSTYARRRHEQLHVMSQSLEITSTDLAFVKAPTLIVVGEFDLVKKHHIDYIAQTIQNSEIIVIQRHSHFVTYTNPKKFSQLVMPFLIKGIVNDKD